MNDIYPLTLQAPDGRERRTLAWFPTEQVRQEFYEKATRHGISVTEM